MAKEKDSTNLTELLLECMSQPDPMLSVLEWLRIQLMEAEASSKLRAEKTNIPMIEPAAGADIVHTVTIPGWTPCTC